MMIHLGESEILKRQMAQPVDRIVGREFSLTHLLEQFADGFGVHSRRQQPLGIEPDDRAGDL